MHGEARIETGDREEPRDSTLEPGLLQGQSHGLEAGSL